MFFESLLTPANVAALALFLASWFGYAFLTGKSRFAHRTLGRRMDVQRERWMRTMLRRDLRMIDTQIMNGLQQGTGFFASSCIFAIGGCFALMGATERIGAVAAELPIGSLGDRGLLEAKLLGLVVIFAHAFFKFAWAYRLFNYCSILIGAVPMRTEAEADPLRADAAVNRALSMNRIAARHFNSGLRAIFFGIAYLGWFLGPFVLMATTTGVLAVIAHRQFRSDAHDAVVRWEEEE